MIVSWNRRLKWLPYSAYAVQACCVAFGHSKHRNVLLPRHCKSLFLTCLSSNNKWVCWLTECCDWYIKIVILQWIPHKEIISETLEYYWSINTIFWCSKSQICEGVGAFMLVKNSLLLWCLTVVYRIDA